MPTFHHALITCCNVPERGTIAQMYLDQDTFDFSQAHVTKNQPMAVPCLVEWKSRNITMTLV